jgi:hypothetical protein
MSNTANTQNFFIVTDAGLTDLVPNQVLTVEDLNVAIDQFGANNFVVEAQNPYSLIKSSVVKLSDDGFDQPSRNVNPTMSVYQAYNYARDYYDNESIGSDIVVDFNRFVFVF